MTTVPTATSTIVRFHIITYKHNPHTVGMSENQHSTDANSRYIRMFNRFFEKGKMAGTYKAVFLRALTDIGKYHRDDLIGKQWIHHDGDEVQLDLDFIASRLAKYYWDMEIAFGMRHMPERMADADEPSADMGIIKLIHKEMERKKCAQGGDSMSRPPSLVLLSSMSMADFRGDVIRYAMVEVLRNLPNDMPELYQRVKGQRYIILEPELIGFMRDFSPVIKKALNYTLAVHLEKYNPSARHIATKIDMEKEFDERNKVIYKLEAEARRQDDGRLE